MVRGFVRNKMAANMIRHGVSPFQYFANLNPPKQTRQISTAVFVAVAAIVFGYFCWHTSPQSERRQTAYPQQDMVDLHDDLFLAHGEKIRTHLDALSSLRFSTDYKAIESARQLVDESSTNFDKVESKIQEFSARLSEQEKLKTDLQSLLTLSQTEIDYINGQELIQKEHVEVLNEAPTSLERLRTELDEVKKSQHEVLMKMENRIEEEKSNRERTSESRAELKQASQHLQAMQRKLRTHLRLVKSTENSLEQIRRNRAEYVRKASTNSAELKQLELKKISTESEQETLKMETESLEAERWTNNEQKQLRISALELLESLSLGDDLASTKSSRELRLGELDASLSALKAKGPSNLKVESRDDVGDSDSLKKVGYFAQLAHNKKVTELESNVAAVKAEIQFINDFGTEDPKFVRESLTQEVQEFDLKLAKLSAREGQMEARIEDVKARLTKIEAEIKQKREFRDNANTNSAQYAVSQDQMESTLRGHENNSKLVEANIDKAREAERTAQRNLDSHLSVKLEDNTMNLNQEKLALDDQHIALHRKIVALLGEHEQTLAKSQEIDSEIRHARRRFNSNLEQIRSLHAEHDQTSLQIKRLYGELQALFR